MKTQRTIEVYWKVGYIDGEGCVGRYRRRFSTREEAHAFLLEEPSEEEDDGRRERKRDWVVLEYVSVTPSRDLTPQELKSRLETSGVDVDRILADDKPQVESTEGEQEE